MAKKQQKETGGIASGKLVYISVIIIHMLALPHQIYPRPGSRKP